LLPANQANALDCGKEETSSAAPPSKETDLISDFSDTNSCVAGLGVGD
jgi:hypothetical protein